STPSSVDVVQPAASIAKTPKMTAARERVHQDEAMPSIVELIAIEGPTPADVHSPLRQSAACAVVLGVRRRAYYRGGRGGGRELRRGWVRLTGGEEDGCASGWWLRVRRWCWRPAVPARRSTRETPAAKGLGRA